MGEPLLLPYQIAWLKDKSQVRIWEKSRRIGASWACAAESVLDAMQAGKSGCDTWYTSYNKDVTQEYIRDCEQWALAFAEPVKACEEFVNIDGVEVLTYVIRFSSGHRITALSSKPTNLRNRKGHVIVDEAAFMPDLTETIKAAMAILVWGGRVSFLSTHNGVDSEFNKLVTDTRAGKTDYSIHRTTFDDAIAQGLFKRVCKVTRQLWSVAKQNEWREKILRFYGDHADEELFCVPRRSGGVYLARTMVEDSMYSAPIVRWEAPEDFVTRDDDQRARVILDWLEVIVKPLLDKLPKDKVHVLGEDFGRTSDLTALVPVTITQELRRKVPFVIELRNTPYREQELVLLYVIDRLPQFAKVALDSTGNGQYLAERALQSYGENQVEMIHLTDKWYSENLPPLRAGFEDYLLAVPRDADVLNDLLAFQVINGVPKLPALRKAQKGDRSKKRHGDVGIALALAYYASRLPVTLYKGYESVKKREQRFSHTRRGHFSRFGARQGSIL